MVERLRNLVQSLPIAHRVLVAASVAGLALLVVLFLQWVSSPSYTVLYSGLDDRRVGEVVAELEAQGVPYELDGGGSTILVPRSQVFATRAALASEGIAGGVAPEGYERLAEQGLTVSDFRQQVDYRIAIEGELAKTLMAMRGVDMATVHLAIPEEELFADSSSPVTASVLVDTSGQLNPEAVETITFMVASAVEDLNPRDVTVADTTGAVLSAPGGANGAGVTDRNLRMTREFEATMVADVTRLLDTAVGPGRASVVVNADLDFDSAQVESETYDPDTQVVIRSKTLTEDYTGTGAGVGGVVGVDGGLPVADADGETAYTREEETVENGVARTVTTSVTAPGDIERLSVSIVMDDGTISGAVTPEAGVVQDIVAAAVNLDQARGDAINVSTVAFPEVVAEDEPGASALGGILAAIPSILGVVLLVLIGVALFLATRRKDDPEDPFARLVPMLAQARAERAALADPSAAPALGSGGAGGGATAEDGASVTELVDRQPEEIAGLLRSWLADAGQPAG